MSRKNIVLFSLTGLVLILPILVYGCRFGLGVWESHEDWARMGSALGGIYSPIIAVFTLVLLYRQQKILEKNTERERRVDRVRYAVTKAEGNITLAAASLDKLDDRSKSKFRRLLFDYSRAEHSGERDKIFDELQSFRAQLACLSRAGMIIHHMRDMGIDMGAHISDLRVYAAGLIDLDLLIAHDGFARAHSGDSSYYSFEISESEQLDVDRQMQQRFSKGKA